MKGHYGWGFKVIGELGHGSFGTVLRVKKEKEECAVKIVDFSQANNRNKDTFILSCECYVLFEQIYTG
jgi:serine/threonine protein kinase